MLSRSDQRSFDLEFPDDDVCLDWLKDQMFPDGIFCESCDRVTKHHRVRTRKSYSCDRCGHHVHPTSGTIYHKSRTPLKKWFYATYLLSSVDPDLPITELADELGVTYKTAWRMTHLIRGMMSDEEEEVDLVEDADEIDPFDDELVESRGPRARAATADEARAAQPGSGGFFGRSRRRN